MSHIRFIAALIAAALLASLSCPAMVPAEAQVPLPDGVFFLDPEDTLQAGSNYTIVLQITINGATYPRRGIGVYLTSSDNAMLDAPVGTLIMTDDEGHATYNVTAGEKRGNVTITATLLSMKGDVRASKTYTIKSYGRITGTVTDCVGRGVPDATVTLYLLNNSARGPLAPIAGNPTVSGLPGMYAFESVPYGDYYVEASVENHTAGTAVSLDRPEAAADVQIASYMVATPTPAPTPTPEPSPTATPVTPSPTPKPKISTGDTLRQGVWILAAALILALIIVAAQLLREKKVKR